ncbi:hypothetical protein RHGRI_030616 [Rhododendron griersonianum]|uniref:Uncharacterized protein n=1 Tax=Rhododendron griersonianum TaxID=479676 RepID=A0AAV6I4P8_9ERIC|nr:hypothetical protein RHGRI_030616 [Rhododendron griersonianum]
MEQVSQALSVAAAELDFTEVTFDSYCYCCLPGMLIICQPTAAGVVIFAAVCCSYYLAAAVSAVLLSATAAYLSSQYSHGLLVIESGCCSAVSWGSCYSCNLLLLSVADCYSSVPMSAASLFLC